MTSLHGAREFDINDGPFYDAPANQPNVESFRISGNNNSTTFSPNLSRNDNRVYNTDQSHTNVMDYNSEMYPYGGPLRGSTLPVQRHQELFLPWQQQGSPGPPYHFQSPYIAGAHPYPPNADRQASLNFNRGNTAGVRSQSYPANTNSGQSYSSPNPAQFQNPHTRQSSCLSPLSPHPAPASPYFVDQQGNWQSSNSVHPAQLYSYSQPVLNDAEFMSEPSEVLSDDSDERRFPQGGAPWNVEPQFGEKANISGPVDQTGYHSPTPATFSQPSTYTTSSTPPTQSSTFFQKQGSSSPPSSQNTWNTQTPSPVHPALSITTMRPQPQPASSIPYVDVTASYRPHNSRPQPLRRHPRPSSSSSSDDCSSDSTNAGNKTKTRAGRIPIGDPSAPPAGALPTPASTESGPLSPQAANFIDGQAPVVFSPPLTPSVLTSAASTSWHTSFLPVNGPSGQGQAYDNSNGSYNLWNGLL